MGYTQEKVSLPGKVYALSLDLSWASELYAGLTGRSSQVCSNIDELTAASHDVVICHPRQLTLKLLRRLYVETGHGAPGLLFARTPDDFKEICRRQAMKFVAPEQRHPGRIFLSSTSPVRIVNHGNDRLIGTMCPANELLNEISSGAAVLMIAGHSNSFDLGLPTHQWLCALLHEGTTAGESLPECQKTGRCTRFPKGPTIADARAGKWLLSVSILRAQIGIIFGCRVLNICDGVYDPANGIAGALLREANLGTIVTTWRVEHAAPQKGHLNDFMNVLGRGTMVGDAVYAFNNSVLARHFGLKLCIVGDPCISLASHNFRELPAPEENTFNNVLESEDHVAEAKLLHAAVTSSLRTDTRQDTDLAKALLGRLASYKKTDITHDAEHLAQTDEVLFEYLRTIFDLGNFFYPFHSIEEMRDDAACPACQSPARQYRSSFGSFGAKSRRIIQCDCCESNTLNIPIHWSVALDLTQVSRRILSVINLPLEAHAAVELVTWASSEGHLFTRVWHLLNLDYLSFELPADLPPVPLYCHVVIVKDLFVGELGVRLMPSGDQHIIHLWNLN